MNALLNCAGDAACLSGRLLGGLTSSAILFLVASGLSLVFGVLGVLNFAHGALYMVGAYFGFTVVKWLGGSTGFWIGLLLAPALTAVFGGVLEMLFFRRIYQQELLYQLLLTYSFVLILNDLVKIVWGPSYLTVNLPAGLDGSFNLLGRPFPIYQVVLIVIALLVAGGLNLLLTRTRIGMVIRAAASDGLMVNALGVNVPTLRTLVFSLGALLGGLGGHLAAPLRSVFPGMGIDLVVDCFIVVVIGGLGSLPGAALGALLIGVTRTFGILLFPELELALIYVLMAAVLILRPRGLLGR